MFRNSGRLEESVGLAFSVLLQVELVTWSRQDGVDNVESAGWSRQRGVSRVELGTWSRQRGVGGVGRLAIQSLRLT